jgi:putative NIF3 family GTP cyclohydrolase 1 type 2
LPQEYTVRAFAEMIEGKLDTTARVYAVSPEERIKRVAVCGGAGGEFFKEAAAMGAQAFVTGEVRHHEALAAVAAGLCVVEAGHYETEHIALKLLADSLQARINELQYNVTVSLSTYEPFWHFRG